MTPLSVVTSAYSAGEHSQPRISLPKKRSEVRAPTTGGRFFRLIRWTYPSTMTLNPPYAMRLRSKGIGSFCSVMSGSFITFAFTASRCARDL